MSEGVIIAIITGTPAIIVALLGLLIRKVNQVHTLTNSRLTAALKEIGELKLLVGESRQKEKDRKPQKVP